MPRASKAALAGGHTIVAGINVLLLTAVYQVLINNTYIVQQYSHEAKAGIDIPWLNTEYVRIP